MKFRLGSVLFALLIATISTVPVHADTLQVYDVSITTDNGATVTGTLTFDVTTDTFIAPSFATVSGESGIYNGYAASGWNGTYDVINDGAVPGTGLYVNLADNGSNLYFQFNDVGGVLSFASQSDVGYYYLMDHFASATLTAVPEPETLAMFAIGLLGLVLTRGGFKRVSRL